MGIFALVALPLTGFLARSMLSLRTSEKLAQAPRAAEITFQELQASRKVLKSKTLDSIILGEKTFSRTVQVSELEKGTVLEILLEIRDTSQPNIAYRYQTRVAKL